MKIEYGTQDHRIDVTTICYDMLHVNNLITIPQHDYTRAQYFTDPLFGVLKSIFITHEDQTYVYDHTQNVYINLSSNLITTSLPDYILLDREESNKKLSIIHSQLRIHYGSLQEEIHEQRMVARYLTGTEKVLELGGNIGRNSLVIASILRDNPNFVVLECNTDIVAQLTENRDLNHFHFFIEPSALSKRPLIQKGWDTIVSDTVLDGYTPVSSITYHDLVLKYNIDFDTLVVDCEGALYYILQDMPEMLDHICLIIMENDYYDITHKKYIDKILREKNFLVDYVESGGWAPCYANFFEVWKKSQ
jgi:FkbM family methyltransferase